MTPFTTFLQRTAALLLLLVLLNGCTFGARRLRDNPNSSTLQPPRRRRSRQLRGQLTVCPAQQHPVSQSSRPTPGPPQPHPPQR